MKVKITGDYRDIANSAWISTINEIRAMKRSDEDARRVVKFLIREHHSSPLESVTLTFEVENIDKDYDLVRLGEWGGRDTTAYFKDNYSRTQFGANVRQKVTIDLLNFVKVTMQNNIYDQKPWKLFSKFRPDLAKMCSDLKPLGSKILTFDDVGEKLGNHNMSVELISLHKEDTDYLSRATWRVKCPLSIAVQILRHRTGSYNMVSGRYRTIKQEMVYPSNDCSEIFNKLNESLEDFLSQVDPVVKSYLSLMKKAKKFRDNDEITNHEYKRLREFARFILPEGRMTELYITYYLDDFKKNYLILRDSVHAQLEHVWIAQEMQKTLNSYKI